MLNRTIVYYSASREDEFEDKIVERIMRVSGELPVISVSQKPMNFGTNICVGKMEHCYKSAFRQCLIGCKRASTPFVVLTESDCYYPEKGYFDFEPTDLNTIYTYDNVWMMWNRENRTRFYKHGTTCGSIIMGREMYVKMLKDGPPNFFDPNLKWETFTGEPLINIKTRNGVSFGTTLTKGVRPKHSFPKIGTVDDLREKLCLNIT
jgi:hypothetical protein